MGMRSMRPEEWGGVVRVARGATGGHGDVHLWMG